MKTSERCRPIELILSDVDGVLTDGAIIYDNQGIELKRFHIHDGLGIQLWQRGGGRFGIVTGRTSHIVEIRAAELGIQLVRQGIDDKLAVVRRLAEELSLRLDQVAYLGDDLPDLSAIQAVGLGVAVPGAAAEVREAADYVTKAPGGHGAVREVIELVLKAQGRWDDLIQGYES